MRRLTFEALLTLVVAFSLAGCKRAAEPGRERPAPPDPSEAPEIRVHPDEDLVYRYFPEGQREPATATSVEDVPAAAREMVIVVPVEPPPAGLAYVADLREPAADGSYPYKVVPTVELDRALDASRGEVEVASAEPTDRRPEPEPAAAPDAEVIMFSASWCGVCSNARRWFRNKGIDFVEKDVEKEPGARQEMMALAEKAGLPASRLTGVPVIWVNGRMFPGFDPAAIQAAL